MPRLRIHPLSILFGYIVLHLLVTVIGAAQAGGGGADFEFVAKSISYFPFYFVGVTLIICFVFPKWSKQYWWFISLLLLFGCYPVISFCIDKYITHKPQGVLFTPFGDFD